MIKKIKKIQLITFWQNIPTIMNKFIIKSKFKWLSLIYKISWIEQVQLIQFYL